VSWNVLGELCNDDFIEAFEAGQRIFHRLAEFAGQTVEFGAADLRHLEVVGQTQQFHTDVVVDLGRRWCRRVAGTSQVVFIISGNQNMHIDDIIHFVIVFFCLVVTESARFDANAIRDERRLQMFADFLVDGVVYATTDRELEEETPIIGEINILLKKRKEKKNQSITSFSWVQEEQRIKLFSKIRLKLSFLRKKRRGLSMNKRSHWLSLPKSLKKME